MLPPCATATNAKLARITLSRCFAWVGIAEEMPLSLRLLKAEIPTYFQNLDPDHAAFAWAPASGAASSNASLAAALSTSLQSNERDAGGDSRREVISLIEDNMQQIERMRSDAARAASLLGSLTPPEGSVA